MENVTGPCLSLPRAAHSYFPPVLSMDEGGETSVQDGWEGALRDWGDRVNVIWRRAGIGL